MSSNALSSQGVDLKIGDGTSPEAFTSIGELTGIDGPGGQASVQDVTDLLSVAKEKKMGLPDEGQITLEMNFLPQDTQHAQLRTDRVNQTERNFQLVFTDSPATTWSFSAYVTGLSISNAVDATMTGSITLEVTGAITET